MCFQKIADEQANKNNKYPNAYLNSKTVVWWLYWIGWVGRWVTSGMLY